MSDDKDNLDPHLDEKGKHHHHILSNAMGIKILVCLLILTFVTVGVSRIDLGAFNAPIAIFIACLKAMLVVLFFMGMYYDSNENRVFFGSAFVFFGLFIILTGADIFTRGDWKVTGPEMKATTDTGGKSSVAKFWTHTDEAKNHGKEIFAQQCAVCHGENGEGNGPASAALNPKPRNFHQDVGWKNGRKMSNIVGTLTNGLNPMPQFNTLPLGDRFSLAQYVQAFGPAAPEDTPDDLKKWGVTDPSKDDGGIADAGSAKRTIPVDFAIDRYVDSATKK